MSHDINIQYMVTYMKNSIMSFFKCEVLIIQQFCFSNKLHREYSMLERGNQYVSGTCIIANQIFPLGWLKRAVGVGGI